MSAEVGDTKVLFGRQYIYLKPVGHDGPGDVGTWRLRVDDTGTPAEGGGGSGGGGSSSIVKTAGTTIAAGQLVYIDSNQKLQLASATSAATAGVIGMALTGGILDDEITVTTNSIEDLFNSGTFVDGSPATLTEGQTYFLSTTPGNWTTTPDTTTAGYVVRSCGVAVEPSKMLIEIQTATVI